ncbi:MAG: hypothetical protein J6M55_01350 [Paludibacteraceae bacterium]|nr:hypothetical protein [Paludibacteraceae bacterium]
MKKSYFQPATEVAEVVTVSRVLMASGDPTPTPSPVPGVNASRNGYSSGETKVW